jgi:hypothetical protein
MLQPVSQRTQLHKAILRSISTAEQSLKFSARNKETAQKVDAAFTALYSAIWTFIIRSPRAFSDISFRIGKAQNLLLAAALKTGEPVSDKFVNWERTLGAHRCSRAGQTYPKRKTPPL